MTRRALMLIAFGGPHRSEDVRPFLRNVLAGRPIPEARFEAVVQHYELLGGRSPITEHTEAQARALSAELARRGVDVDVRIGMRHWTPFIKDALQGFQNDGYREVQALIMAAQETEASLARYMQAVDAARADLGEGAPSVSYVLGWGLDQKIIDAHVSHVEQTLARLAVERRDAAALLFTAHSVPVSMAQGSPYVAQLQATAERVAQKLGRKDYRLVYQSRSGNPRDAWLEPDVLDALQEEAARGVRDLVLAPIGFLCDHVEVLYDLDVEAKRKADALGIGLYRAPTLGAHPSFIAALADRVESVL
jgi:ferrochelatase